jgi:hypothetical protein
MPGMQAAEFTGLLFFLFEEGGPRGFALARPTAKANLP